ncbi:TIGR03619 family F420-dependent LLM class oxidoreductase [Streptomyces sp. NPDC058374]|uniref:TIGR03619 family F420-dependent LLM class oxidoreductase n=1 Tax=unclassified Streptomyces TaxID=2593676 RepID=UPI003668E3C3
MTAPRLPLRLGAISPVVTRFPGAHSAWEEKAGIAELATIAQAADELGYDHLTCSEHVAVPSEVAAARGATYWDPLATFGYLAARTHRIRLATHVLVLGYHHPLEIAKRYGTLDRVSGGRLVLGLGVGTLKEEFGLLGAEFGDRGARADDALAALRASLSRPDPEYHGRYYDYSGMVVEPHAVQPRVPLWIGGSTRRSLRRAVELGDGWAPFGLSLEQLAELLGSVERPDGFEVVLSPSRRLDPRDDPKSTEALLRQARQAGATVVTVRLASSSADDHCVQLEALTRVAEAL